MVTYQKADILLSVENVSLQYGDKHILRDINFQIRDIIRPGKVQGQVVSIIGVSGSGKSSLFNILSKYNEPTSGTIKIGVDQHPVQLGEVGVVPQNYPLFEHRTVYKNLHLALSSIKTTDKEKDDAIKSYAEYFGLSEQLQKFPCDLSGGQKQRVSIMQQVLAGNKFILLDEPFSGLDIKMKDKVIEILLKIADFDELNTLIIVSHDIESACAISDTVHVIANKDGNGSTIIKSYDFLEMGIAYESYIKQDPRFQKIISEIISII